MHVPATPGLLRTINDRAALEALLERGPLTRVELGRAIRLSKPTTGQLLDRLRAEGLVVHCGRRSGSPGRSADLYGINPRAAHVCGVGLTARRVRAVVADVTGTASAEHELPLERPGRALAVVRAAVAAACAATGIDPGGLDRIVIAVQGAVDPGTGRLGYSRHLPGSHMHELVPALRASLGTTVEVENDVNLAAVAEMARGVARGEADFVMLWVGTGIGMAIVLGGRLYRGAEGWAGEIGYLPVPGAPTARETGRHADHGLQSLAGTATVRALLRAHGLRGSDAPSIVRSAAARRDDPAAADALRDLAIRVATGLSAVVAILDPSLIVLTGEVMLAGGEPLRLLVEHELHRITIPQPALRISAVEGDPVLAGAVEHALAATRGELVGSAVPTGRVPVQPPKECQA